MQRGYRVLKVQDTQVGDSIIQHIGPWDILQEAEGTTNLYWVKL